MMSPLPSSYRHGSSLLFLTFLVVLAAALPPQVQARSDVEPPMAYGAIPDQIYAIRDPYIFTHNAGLLTLQITNVGLIGNPFNDDLSAGWRGVEYLFFSGLWIGAIGSDTEPHVSTASQFELRPDLDVRWTIYESFEGVKNGMRLGFQGLAIADDDNDGVIDEDFHNGFDDDGDGLIDEDYAAIGQQMFSCVYRDDTPEAIVQEPDHFPLGVLVRQRSFQWSTDGISEFVGFDFEIINTGEQRLKELYFGLFFDGDIGLPTDERYWTDDLVGWDIIDTTLADQGVPGPCGSFDATIPATFMWDAPGSVPGVFGTLLLDHPTDETGLRAPETVDLHTVAWFSAAGQNADPQNDDERYQLLASGTRPVSNPRPGVATGSGSIPDDYRYVWSAGSFAELNPGESLEFQVAYVIGEGFSGFRQNAANAWRVFNGRYVDADENPDTGIDGKERCLQILERGGEIVWDDPCDTLFTTVTFGNTPPPCNVAGPHHVDADCDPCTGVGGRETQVNWIGTVAPPSPTTNLDPSLYPFNDPDLQHLIRPAGDGQVTVQWDNGSQLWKEPFTGLDIFAGYRIWKVSDWPGGAIGPAPEDWVQIAEFRTDVPTPDPSHLARATNTGVDPIGMTDDSRPIYPIGRYEFVDPDVINDHSYFYAVTAFGTIATSEGTLELDDRPASPLSWVVVPGVPVPVRLLAFSVDRLGGEARLQWVVAEAENHAGFHVHRGEPGKQRIRLTSSLLSGRTEYEFIDSDVPTGQVEYWLQELSRSGESQWHGPVTLEAATNSPGMFAAGMASPNPFQTRMNLAYTLPDVRPVRVSIYDLSGRRVRTLVNETQGPGDYTAQWRARTDAGARVVPGLYFIRIEAGTEVLSRKVLHVR